MNLKPIIDFLRPKPKPVPDPFDVQANALKPIMGPGDLVPEYVEDRTGSPMAGFAAGFVNPASLLRRNPPMRSDIFVGPNSKTWDAKRAEEATKLLRQGKNPHPATGTHLGADNKLRQEIDDSTSKMIDPEWIQENYKLREIYDHPELYAAYPEVADMPAKYVIGGQSAFLPKENRFEIGLDAHSDTRSPILHEIQHKIQELERWSKGGNPSMFVRNGEDVTPYAMDQYRNLAGEVESRLTQNRLRMSKQHRGYADPATQMEDMGHPINGQSLFDVERSVPPPGTINQPQYVQQLRTKK
jgi:hypothetical protein